MNLQKARQLHSGERSSCLPIARHWLRNESQN